METSWKEGITASKFDSYNDILEQVLGFNSVFKILMENPAKKNILDYGCGPGKVAERLAEISDYNVIAVDESPKMLEIASDKRSHPRVEYHLIEKDSLSFIKDCSLDGAMVCFVFINTKSRERILKIIREIYRVLKPQFPLVVLDTNPDSTGIEFSTFQNGLPGKKYACGESRQEWLHIPGQEDLVLNDFHWPKSMYLDLFKEAGFSEIELLEPTLRDISEEELKAFESKYQFSNWKNEREYPPFVIFRAAK